MDWKDLIDVLLRWAHVIAGVMWIGHLWFFNFVNSQVAKTYDADAKKKVAPELMPRALYWFRWGAAFTWIFGVGLLSWVYYMNRMAGTGGGGIMVPADGAVLTNMTASLLGLVLLVVGWLVYDSLWKVLAKGNALTGAFISWALVTLLAFILVNPWKPLFTGRAMFIHVAAVFGTSMAANVWMRIWPAQRKIIAALKAGEAPPEGLGPLAGLRSKHNTYMSIPLLAIMISNHWSTLLDASIGSMKVNWIIVSILVAGGWLFTKWLYTKAASPAPAQY